MKVLNDTLISLLRGLPARADARLMISAMPLGGIFWEDEMPESAAKSRLSGEERNTLWRLFAIRYKIWDDEPLSPDDQSLWDSARASVPTWALFHRLTLTDAVRKSREEAREEVESTWKAIFGDADEIEQTGVAGRVGPPHCRCSFIADQEVFFLGRTSDRPVQEPRSEELANLIGGPLPGALGHPAAFGEHRGRAVALKRLLVNKRVRRHAGAWAPKSGG